MSLNGHVADMDEVHDHDSTSHYLRDATDKNAMLSHGRVTFESTGEVHVVTDK